MLWVYIDITILLLLFYINYRKYKFSTEFNLKQNTGLATIFFIIVFFGVTIPSIAFLIVKFSDTEIEFFNIYKLRYQVYWILGLVQLIYLFWINTKIKSKSV
ncbi:hypothetical protein ATE84_3019 [Aquimarina sp. MAR_2010_214]|nr:hypothetical protein ATE84_3019 [Aquimarina sp. MAR_2010_214]